MGFRFFDGFKVSEFRVQGSGYCSAGRSIYNHFARPHLNGGKSRKQFQTGLISGSENIETEQIKSQGFRDFQYFKLTMKNPPRR